MGMAGQSLEKLLDQRTQFVGILSLCKLSEQELLLFYRIGKTPRQVVSFLKRSLDGGRHWTEPEILPAGILGPTQCKPVVTPTGMLICPSSIAVGEPEDVYKATAVKLRLSFFF